MQLSSLIFSVQYLLLQEEKELTKGRK